MELAQPLQITIQTWQAIVGLIGFIFVVGVAWGTLKTDVNNLGKNLKELKGNFDSFILDLATKSAKSDGDSNSPLKPNANGNEILDKSGARSVIEKATFKDWFFQMIDKKKPKTGFDVEEEIFSTLLKTSDDPRWDGVKDFIFNNPIYTERPLTLKRILIIVSWVLRDEYMESRNIKNI